jgi:prepilin-type N-terminal cleavage/methylation domain-containing protein
MKMKKLKKSERGFTLIELLIAIAITGIIAGAITGAVFQVFSINTRTTNRMAAVSQVQNAGFWVSPDVQMAQNVTPGGCPNCLLTLSWTDWEGDEHEVIYTLEDMSGGVQKLQRSHSVNGGDPTVTRVAEYINPAGTSCVWADGELTFTVTATVGGESETRVYLIEQRVKS